MQHNFSETEITYIESVKKLNRIQQFGSTVNRHLVEIYRNHTGEDVSSDSCCYSKRAIFFQTFMTWYNDLTESSN